MKPLRRLWQGPLVSSLVVLAATSSALAQTLPSAPEPPPGQSLTLAEAVAQALKANPRVRQTAAGRALADARTREAAAGWFPRVELSTTVTRGNNPVYVFGSLLEQSKFTADRFAVDALNDPGPVNNVRSAASVQVPLFDQLQTSTRLAQARLGQDQARRQQRLVEQQLRFEVVRAYFGAVLAEAREQAAAQAVKSAEADVGRIRNLHEGGLVVRSDLLGAEVQLSEFRQQAIEAAGDAAVANAALDTVLGVQPGAPHRLSGQLAAREFTLPSEADLVGSAAANRPDYAMADTAVGLAREDTRRAIGQYLPRLDAFGTYAASSHTLGVDSTDWLVGAKLSFPLLDVGRGARVDQANAAVAAALADRDQAASLIGLEVVGAYRHFLSARERLKVAAGAAEQAAEALRIVQDRYQASLTTITEVLRAQTAQLRAHFNELAARFDLYVGYAQVRLAAGNLNDADAFVP